METNPTSLPELSKPSRDLKNLRKTKILEPKFLEKIEKINDYYLYFGGVLGGFSEKFGPNNFGFLEVFGDPGGFRKLREACRKKIHLVAPPKTSVVPSYDQKNKKMTSIKLTSAK